MEKKLKKWYELSQKVKELKAKEQRLRREICEEMFDGKLGEFAVGREYGNYSVKATSRVTRSIDETVLESIEEDLTAQELSCIKRKASLVLASYKKLPGDSLLYEAITEKPAMPSLKLDL